MVRLLRYQVVTILFLNILLTLTMVSSVQAMCKNYLGLICDCVCVCLCICRCMCKIDMYCNCYSIFVTETMVTADKNIDLMLKKFKLMILNILNI